MNLSIKIILLCDVCERPLPDDDTKIDIALFGVDRACPGCKQPLSEEEWYELIEKINESCQNH
jgi:hypothetical protein